MSNHNPQQAQKATFGRKKRRTHAPLYFNNAKVSQNTFQKYFHYTRHSIYISRALTNDIRQKRMRISGTFIKVKKKLSQGWRENFYSLQNHSLLTSKSLIICYLLEQRLVHVPKSVVTCHIRNIILLQHSVQ